jgi:ribonuclease HI
VERNTQRTTRNVQNIESNKKGKSTYVVMTSTLNILQANLYRSSGVQDALYNDPDIWDFDAILIQEPHYWEIAGNLQVTGVGPNFEVIKPKTLQRENQTQRIRSCMWINSNVEYTQLTMNSNDITAVVLKHGNRNIRVASIYIPNIGNGYEADEQELHSRLQEVHEAIMRERNNNLELEVFIAGDFNRHDTVWGGKAEKALKAALALKRLQGLYPATMRQLYTATVAPVMDYASPVWYLAVSDKTLAVLHRAQRVAAQAIVGGFRTMGLDFAVLEAGIPSLQQRLHEQTLRFWISIQKLEASHIHAKLAKTKPIRRFDSPLRKAAGLFRELDANRAEKIPAIGCEPWSPEAHVHILDREAAKLATAEQPATIDFYTDGSVRNGRAGIGIWTSAWEASRTIRRAEETNVHLTELEAIWMAIKGLSHEHNRLVKIRVFTDSQSALRSIQSAKINDSLGLVKKVREKIAKATFSLHCTGSQATRELKAMRGRTNQPRRRQKSTHQCLILQITSQSQRYTQGQKS